MFVHFIPQNGEFRNIERIRLYMIQPQMLKNRLMFDNMDKVNRLNKIKIIPAGKITLNWNQHCHEKSFQGIN